MNKHFLPHDKTLVDLLKEDKTEAFEEIYFRYWKKLYSAGFKRIHNKEICEELVQDIFTSLWVNRKELKIEHLSSYLFTAIKYKVINYLKHEMTKKNYVDNYLTSASLIDNSTEDFILSDDLKIALQKEINKLPARCQLVFKLSREDNLSMKQVAHKLGISEKTVENQLGKAIKVLKSQLKNLQSFLI